MCYSRAQKKGPEGFLREAPSQPVQSPVPAPCHRGDAGRGCCQGRLSLVLPESAKQPSPPALITATSSRRADRPLIKTSWVPTCPALPGQSQQQSQLLSASCCRQSSCLLQRCPHRVPNLGTGQQHPAPSPSPHSEPTPRGHLPPLQHSAWERGFTAGTPSTAPAGNSAEHPRGLSPSPSNPSPALVVTPALMEGSCSTGAAGCGAQLLSSNSKTPRRAAASDQGLHF